MLPIAQYNTALKERYTAIGHLSIPDLQITQRVSYREAKQIIAYGIARRWLSSNPRGIRYTVIKRSFALQTLTHTKCTEIGEDISRDAMRVLLYLAEHENTTFSHILQHVDDDESDMQDAIDELRKWDVILLFGGTYLINIASSSVKNIQKAFDSSDRGKFF